MRARVRNFFGALIVALSVVGLAVHLARPTYERCDFFTKELNGGVKTFSDKVYVVRLCGADIRNGNEIRLQILDADGELLAQRYFSYFVNSASERDLVDAMGSIIYYDSSSADPMKAVQIPPTKWDWIRARLPLF